MFKLRSQKLKILRLAEESNLARIESMVRTEPYVAKVHGFIHTARLAKALGAKATGALRNNPKSPYAAIAGSFAVSLLLPLLFGRSKRGDSQTDNP